MTFIFHQSPIKGIAAISQWANKSQLSTKYGQHSNSW